MNRELGCAAGVPASGVQSAPFQSTRWAGGASVRPSHHTSPSSVSATFVKIVSGPDSVDRRAVGQRAGSGCHPEEASLGVDRAQAPVRSRRDPCDVVANGLDLPAGQRGRQHGEIGLSAGGRERGGDVEDPVRGRGDLEKQHVFGKPALVARDHRCDPQCEALLSEDRVAAIGGSVRPNLTGLREVANVLGVVARPGNVLLAWSQGCADASARKAPMLCRG